MSSKAKYLEAREWVALAAGTTKDYAPVLEAIHSNGSRLAATNRHILFLADVTKGSYPEGMSHAKTGRVVEGTYPNVEQVIPSAAATVSVDVLELRAWAEAAKVFDKTMGTNRGLQFDAVAVSGDYVLRALAGVHFNTKRVNVCVRGERDPLRFDLEGGRTAVVMPISSKDGSKPAIQFPASSLSILGIEATA